MVCLFESAVSVNVNCIRSSYEAMSAACYISGSQASTVVHSYHCLLFLIRSRSRSRSTVIIIINSRNFQVEVEVHTSPYTYNTHSCTTTGILNLES